MKPSGVLFGVHTPKELVGFPRGKCRVRMRADDYVSVYVRNENGIARFTVAERDGVWVPALLMSSNLRPPKQQQKEVA